VKSNEDICGLNILVLPKGGQKNMDQKSSKVKLDDLPRSDDKDFWLDAEIHTGIEGLTIEEAKKKVEEEKEKHYFVRTTGRQAQCTHCDWGFELDPGDKIIDGHLYNKKGKLII